MSSVGLLGLCEVFHGPLLYCVHRVFIVLSGGFPYLASLACNFRSTVCPSLLRYLLSSLVVCLFSARAKASECFSVTRVEVSVFGFILVSIIIVFLLSSCLISANVAFNVGKGLMLRIMLLPLSKSGCSPVKNLKTLFCSVT